MQKRAFISEPTWKKITVESNLPTPLKPLKKIAKNIWWVWSKPAQELFEKINPITWEKNQNPIKLLEETTLNRFVELAEDTSFIYQMQKVEADLDKYLDQRSEAVGPQIAYFSMEYGLHTSLRIYSGGLGILAGDYLKEASDSNSNMNAVGLFYRYGYFNQSLSSEGDQIAGYEAEVFEKTAAKRVLDKAGNQVEVSVQLPGREVFIRVWQVAVGAITLYLLDTDFYKNSDLDRSITHHLYGGDNENRLRQEIVLGIGGIRALKAVNIEAEVYHCNEGHAAFIGLERIKDHVQGGLSFDVAKELVSASTLFTTHTPVPAGHDAFHMDLFRFYMGAYADAMGIDAHTFEMLGKARDWEEEFNMSYLAAHLSQQINGVSRLHGDVSKELLNSIYPGYLQEEITKIGYVTNGVHYPTWVAEEWREFHDSMLKREKPISILEYNEEEECKHWKKVYRESDSKIWNIKQGLKKNLFNFISERLRDNTIQQNENPKYVSETLRALDPNALTIGFARRFATYKRAHLLFRDLERLAKIVNNSDRPVQFLFAGKAHPADKGGQGLIKFIREISQRPEFIGKILFIQNYDITVAQKMLQGVDIWMNTPTRPLEASGTSGEKGVMNGTLHFSVLDGWWCEGYKRDAGWALAEERTYEDQDLQDDLDAETIYNIFENEIVPAYYYKDTNGIPHRWVSFIKNTFAEVAPHFTTTRMLRDYYDRFYLPQAARSGKIKANDNKLAIEIAEWKSKVASVWNEIEVVSQEVAKPTNDYQLGSQYPITVTLNTKGLDLEDIGVELITASTDDVPKLLNSYQFAPISKDGELAIYKLDIKLSVSGIYNTGIRIYPKHDELPQRQDFERVIWI